MGVFPINRWGLCYVLHHFGYRGAQIGVENIVKKDPGKAKQKVKKQQ